MFKKINLLIINIKNYNPKFNLLALDKESRRYTFFFVIFLKGNNKSGGGKRGKKWVLMKLAGTSLSQ